MMIRVESVESGVDVKTEGSGLKLLTELTTATFSVAHSLSNSTGDDLAFTAMWVLSKIQNGLLAAMEKKNRP